MIKASIRFKCKLCGNDKNFYIMPLFEKVGEKDYINSKTRYKLQCKECGKNYLLTFNIKAL